MATKLGVSIADYVHREIIASKPTSLGVSEWVEELLVKGMNARKRTEMPQDEGEGMSPAGFIRADGSLILELPIAFTGHLPESPDCQHTRWPLDRCPECRFGITLEEMVPPMMAK